MDDLMRLLPFIIGILYFVFGGNKKKKQTSNPSKKRKKPSTTTPSLEDILRELQGGNKAPEPVPAPPPIKQPSRQEIEMAEYENRHEKKPNKLEFEDHTYDFRPEYEHHADTGISLKDLRIEIEEDKGIESVASEQVANLTLRDLIINDAILNRPYQ